MDENKSAAQEQNAAAVTDAGDMAKAEGAEAAGAENPAQAEAGSGTDGKNDTQTAQEAASQGAVEGTPPHQDADASGQGASQAADEPDPLVKVTEQLASATKALLTTRAEAEAAKLAIPESRVKHVLRLADLTNIDPAAADAPGKVREALEKVLSDVPELRGGGTGSPGAFRQKAETPQDAFERGFRRG